MEWRVWTAWWILYHMRNSRLFWIQHQNVWNSHTKYMLTKFKTKLYSRLNFGTILSFEVLKKITKDKNVENVPQLEITEAVLVLCNIVKN